MEEARPSWPQGTCQKKHPDRIGALLGDFKSAWQVTKCLWLFAIVRTVLKSCSPYCQDGILSRNGFVCAVNLQRWSSTKNRLFFRATLPFDKGLVKRRYCITSKQTQVEQMSYQTAVRNYKGFQRKHLASGRSFSKLNFASDNIRWVSQIILICVSPQQ